MIFYSPTKGKLDLKGVIKELLVFVNGRNNGRYKLIIGSDSSARGKTEFVTALIIHHVGHGGRYFWHKESESREMVLRERIYKEVSLSLELAQMLLEALPPEELRKNLEIHLDVGKNGPTREMIREVVGMVKGSGFNCKTKPNSYGASHIADKHV
jgi:predicted RNase H-related nuclease YkuK (DUF458 family)